MKTRELVSAGQQVNGIEGQIVKFRDKFQRALPPSLPFDRAFQAAINCVKGSRSILECEPISILSCVMESMQLGLVLDGVMGHAYIVPYNNRREGIKQAQFIPGYKGLMELAYRTGKVNFIQAQIVREGDVFEYEQGTSAFIRHVPGDKENAKVTHIYALAKLASGDTPFEVMTFKQVEAIRKGAKSQKGPWIDHWDEMARKTAIRRLCKCLPASADLQRAVNLAEYADANLGPQILPGLEDEPEPEPLTIVGEAVPMLEDDMASEAEMLFGDDE